MAYERQYHTNGDVLDARQMNHMETGIKENSDNIDKLSEEKVDLPKDENGNIQKGITGQFAVSDGNGGITWTTLADGNEVAY